MFIPSVNPKSKTPLYLQIIQQVIEMVEQDILKPGSILPPTRTMAARLGVNRSTVYNAYQELWAQGYIESRPGSYSRIRRRPKTRGFASRPREGVLRWPDMATSASETLYREFLKFHPERLPEEPREAIIDMASLNMDPRLVPAESFRHTANRVMLRHGAAIMGYGDHRGYPPLRATIAERMRLHGITVDKDDILITNGSQNGLELVLKLLSRPDRAVVVESPTYAIALPLFRFHGAKLVPIPMTPTGMDLAGLRKTLASRRIAFVYTMPNFQNPTGITTSQAHREALISICREFRIPIVEDGFEEEMKYFGKVPLPIKSMDREHIVVYLGTFSKVFAPGLRLGWVTADRPGIDRLLAIKRFSDLSSSTLLQATMHGFFQHGHYEFHIKRMHRIFRKRMTHALDALKRHLRPTSAVWQAPSGGYLIWMRLGKRIPPEVLLDECLRQGVLVSPGHYYFTHPPEGTYLRLSIATLDEGEIEEGITRLGQAVNRVKDGM